MSWGERSCNKYGQCKIANVTSCNKKCEKYTFNVDYVEPHKQKDKPIELEDPIDLSNEPQLVRSPFTRFDIKREVIILHGNIYEIQSVTPKKLVLKFKKGLTKGVHGLNTTMIDGVFAWAKNGEILDAKKVLRESRIEVKKGAVKDE